MGPIVLHSNVPDPSHSLSHLHSHELERMGGRDGLERLILKNPFPISFTHPIDSHSHSHSHPQQGPYDRPDHTVMVDNAEGESWFHTDSDSELGDELSLNFGELEPDEPAEQDDFLEGGKRNSFASMGSGSGSEAESLIDPERIVRPGAPDSWARVRREGEGEVGSAGDVDGDGSTVEEGEARSVVDEQGNEREEEDEDLDIEKETAALQSDHTVENVETRVIDAGEAETKRPEKAEEESTLVFPETTNVTSAAQTTSRPVSIITNPSSALPPRPAYRSISCTFDLPPPTFHRSNSDRTDSWAQAAGSKANRTSMVIMPRKREDVLARMRRKSEVAQKRGNVSPPADGSTSDSPTAENTSLANTEKSTGVQTTAEVNDRHPSASYPSSNASNASSLRNVPASIQPYSGPPTRRKSLRDIFGLANGRAQERVHVPRSQPKEEFVTAPRRLVRMKQSLPTLRAFSMSEVEDPGQGKRVTKKFSLSSLSKAFRWKKQTTPSVDVPCLPDTWKESINMASANANQLNVSTENSSITTAPYAQLTVEVEGETPSLPFALGPGSHDHMAHPLLVDEKMAPVISTDGLADNDACESSSCLTRSDGCTSFHSLSEVFASPTSTTKGESSTLQTPTSPESPSPKLIGGPARLISFELTDDEDMEGESYLLETQDSAQTISSSSLKKTGDRTSLVLVTA